MRTLLSIPLVLPLAAALALGAAAPAFELDCQAIAKDHARRLGLPTESPAGLTLDALLTQHFVRADLGAYELHWPVHGLPGRSSEFRDCAEALIEAQLAWLDWTQTKGADTKAVRADLSAVLKWVQGWNVQALARGKPGEELVAIARPQDAQAAAITRACDALRRLTPIGHARETPRSVRILVEPTRQDFAEFVYFAGWLREDLRPSLWLQNVPDWTQCFVDDIQILCLQYAANARMPNDYTLGSWMNERDPDVMQQQIVQLAMNGLFRDHYESRVPGAFISGLSMNLVIDVFGVVNTRVDGDTRSKFTQEREVFVPGGQSEGGQLAKHSAETRWRENQGKDHFLPCLRQCQSEGADLGRNEKNKLACFAVRDDSGGGKHLVKAPFLGTVAAETQPPPPQFRGDWAEFLRAYKSAFIFWLQTAAGGSAKASKERFATLMRKLADPNLSADFEAVFQEVYEGAPLSEPEVGKDSLEGQFLRWLAKQR
jgi:hypothetical protein